ncbi:GntR family transcriptional regulator [Tistrella mobilis]|uniref:GntR family transcriptional regulator n=1 Tax=Tistrella mobilis TaxID=171437 RepID=UPI0031F6FD35
MSPRRSVLPDFTDIATLADLDRRPLASQGIYAALRRRIIDLELKPGALLSRTQLAEEYAVSQTPVRDAFLRLEREKLVEIFPQSRTVVAKIDIAHARETQFLRLAIEIEVAKTIARHQTPADLTAYARRLLHLQGQAFADGDIERFSILDRHFHLALYDAVGHPDLWYMIAERSGHIDRLRALNLVDPGKAQGILDYHGRILDRIDAGDTAGVEEAVRGHLSGTLSAVARIMERHPDYF